MTIFDALLALLASIPFLAVSVLCVYKYNRVRKTGEDIGTGKVDFSYKVEVTKGEYVKKGAWQYLFSGALSAIPGLMLLWAALGTLYRFFFW